MSQNPVLFSAKVKLTGNSGKKTQALWVKKSGLCQLLKTGMKFC